MTLQERLKASAKELVRLLEEDERERDRKAERVDRLANQPIKRFFKKLEDEGLISPVEMKVDTGKEFGYENESSELLAIAGEIDRMLQAYPARKALRIVDICKVLVTERYSVRP